MNETFFKQYKECPRCGGDWLFSYGKEYAHCKTENCLSIYNLMNKTIKISLRFKNYVIDWDCNENRMECKIFGERFIQTVQSLPFTVNEDKINKLKSLF